MSNISDSSFEKQIVVQDDDGEPIRDTKSYGIGIDTHRDFIQVCVLVKRDLHFYAHQKEFQTDWNSLIAAKDWCKNVLKLKSDIEIDLSLPLHYCIESTATYHLPILLAFEDTPSIVNPTLAGSTKRKTDVLDAQMLATQDLMGIWRESFVPTSDHQELRVLLWERERCIKEYTAAGKRINNCLLRFGYTIGRNGSVADNQKVRELAEAIANGEVDLPENLCPYPVPDDVREVIISEYQKRDHLKELSTYWYEKAYDKVLSMKWETGDSIISGQEMLDLLMTAPQIGQLTAITFLAYIITPRRFPNAKALSAYCGLDPSLKISAGKVTSTRKRGGTKALHKVLVSAGDRLISNKSEMFGRWGFNIYCQTDKKKLAANAVARKLAVALYYMMLTNRPFSYENYSLVKDLDILDIPIASLPSIEPAFKRYIPILQQHDINSTSDLVKAYLSCEIGSYKGLGRKFHTVLKQYLNNQRKYKKLYDDIQNTKEMFEKKEVNSNEQQSSIEQSN